MKHILLSLFVIMLTNGILAGCSDTSNTRPSTTVEILEPTAPGEFKPVHNPQSSPLPEGYKPGDPILFIDSFAFDMDLSSILRHEVANVEIQTQFSMNEIPKRLDEWFTVVKKSGGKIQAQKITPPTRGILGMIIDIAIALMEQVSNAALYSPAKQYNVMMYFDDANIVKKVVFKRRLSAIPE